MKALAAQETGWWMGLNPLLGLSLERAQQIYDAARRGCSPLLHRVYDAIEAADPVLMTCVERRSSALAGLGWHSTARAGVDDGLAKEQRQFIDDLADGIGDLEEALEHLDLAFFRGFSHVQPVWEGGRVRRIQTLDSWNFMRRADGTWLWNPEAREGDGEGLEEITPEARLVTVRRPRAIDYPAMAIHIRKALGERDWGRFVERYGIPPVDAVMAAGATEEQRNEYLAAAEAARDGRCVVWPSGSTVSRAEGARGQDPFSAFQEHQERLVVLMATGGTLTSLAQADTGSLAGGAQMDVWEEIVRRDAKIIGAALDRALFRPAVEAAFPGRPVAAQFELGTEATPSTAEVFETAGKARAAGYRVAREELEEASGYTLVPDEGGEAGGLGGAAFSRAFNREGRTGTPLQNADPSNRKPGEKVAASPLLRAFAADTGAAAERMAALLDKLDAGEDVAAEARKLADELPGLMRGEPELAAVLEEEMAKAFAGEIEAAKNAKGTKGEEKAVANSECRSDDPAHCRVHGTPEGGKREIRAVKSSPKADGQARECGYKDVADMMAQARDVPAERVAEIQEGFSGRCKPHEAVAVISENKPFEDAEGNSVRFGDDIIEHYVEGRRRRDNEPKVDNLADLPFAVKAVKTDTYGVTRYKYPRGTTPDPLDPPRGTQREYHLKTERGQMKVFVYIQGGKINGWHVEQ